MSKLQVGDKVIAPPDYDNDFRGAEGVVHTITSFGRTIFQTKFTIKVTKAGKYLSPGHITDAADWLCDDKGHSLKVIPREIIGKEEPPMARKPVIKLGDEVEIIDADGTGFSVGDKGLIERIEEVETRTGKDVIISVRNASTGTRQLMKDNQVKKIVRRRKSISEKVEDTKVSVPATPGKIEEHQIIGQDHNKKMLDVAIKNDLPVLLVGETGTGKTSLIREQAIERKADWVRFNLTGETTVDEFVGKYELEGGGTVWRDGILLQAMKEGKWLIVDEINVALPEILFVLHSLLDDDKFVVVASHSGEIVRPHESFRFFATMNPVDEYAGTKELNKAFQSRFNMVLKVHYPDNKTESKIIQDKTGVTAATANKMSDVAVALRKAKNEDKIFYTCSTRDLLQWGKLTKDLGMEDAFIVSILNKANGDKDTMVKVYDRIVGKHLTLENQGYELNIDWFEAAAKKLEADKKKFEADKENTRREITEEIVRKLTSASVETSKPATGRTIELDEVPF